MKPRTIPLLLTSPISKNITEGDCACSFSAVDISLPDALLQGGLVVSDGLIRQKLDDDFQVFLSPSGSKGASILNKAATRILNSFSSGRTQTDVLADCDLVELTGQFLSQGLVKSTKENQPSDSGLTQPDMLTVWLHLTDRCNFRCSYCYLPHVQEDMSAEIGHLVIDSALRSGTLHGFKKIKLKYAGGEPLLNYPLILELHSYAKRMAEECGFSLEEVVLSNGSLLTSEIASTLKSLNIHLMISLDGLGNYHDTQRAYAGGHGSFRNVSNAVDLALANGLLPNISVTVSGKTIEGLPSLMTWMLDRDLPFNLNFYRENEFSASNTDMKLEEQKIIKGMLAAFDVVASNLPGKSVLGSIIDRANMMTSHTRTCGVDQSYLVFDQNGRVAKCQMYICKPVTDIKVHDPLVVLQSDRNGIQNLSVEEKAGCKTCEWKYWCAGGCPLATFRMTGRYDVKSPYCNIYKALFPEALRLEGLRIMKYSEGLLD
jgi:uncharacterized protein